MDLIKYARNNRYHTRIQCGWKFSPKIYLREEIILQTPFTYNCQFCDEITTLDCLDKMCENCYDGVIYPYETIDEKIHNFDFEVIETKDFDFDFSGKYYKIKINEFYGTVFCGIFEEPNEWSSTPHDDYYYLTFLFKDIESCDEEYKSNEILKEQLK